MSIISRITRNPRIILKWWLAKIGWIFPDKTYLKMKYYVVFGRKLNLDNPKTYTEKLQWIKLFDRNPEYTVMVDKIEAKKWVEKRIGKRYIIPTLGVWENVKDINIAELPEKFVLKTNHDSGGLYICKNKDQMVSNWKDVGKKLKKSLNTNFYKRDREWPYKNVERKIFAEELLETSSQDLKDYKFFCFDGKPCFLFVASDRQTEGVDVKFDFYDINFNYLEITNGHDNAIVKPNKPKNYEEMVRLATILSQGFKHVRVDLYNIEGRIFFGELTFFHHAGFCKFNPEEWDYKFGQLLSLPMNK